MIIPVVQELKVTQFKAFAVCWHLLGALKSFRL